MNNADLEYCLTIDVLSAKRRFVFFLGLIGSLNILSFFYNRELDLGYVLVNTYSLVGVIGGVLLLIDKIKNIRSVGFILCSCIFMHATLELTDLFFDHDNTIAIWLSSLIWYAFAYSFTVNWAVIIEPYFEGYQQLIWEESWLLSSLRQKKSPLCIGCRKNKNEK
jgi:hypothetical protein